jgi:stringent starvation protein B
VAALKTHLLRAVYDWAVENGFTPNVVVDTRADGVRVPPGYADENGRMVLNIHPRAVHGFAFDDHWLRFSARFGGNPHGIEVPLAAILAVYARENGQGISFPTGGENADPTPDDGGASTRKRPALKVVK